MKEEWNGKRTDRGGERARWVREYRDSGLGLKQFAQRHGLRPGQLHYWVYQTPKPRGKAAPVAMFQEVRLAAPAALAGTWSAEIGLPDGTTVRLARGTDPAWGVALVDSLRRPCS